MVVSEILVSDIVAKPSKNIAISFDYFVWISIALVLIAGYFDLRFCRGYSYISTSLLTLLGLSVAIFSRASSAI